MGDPWSMLQMPRGELMIETNGFSALNGIGNELWRDSLQETSAYEKAAHSVAAPTSSEASKFGAAEDKGSDGPKSQAEEQVRSIVARLRMVALRMSDAALTDDQKKLLEAELKDLHQEVQATVSKIDEPSEGGDVEKLQRTLSSARGLGNLLENSLRTAEKPPETQNQDKLKVLLTGAKFPESDSECETDLPKVDVTL